MQPADQMLRVWRVNNNVSRYPGMPNCWELDGSSLIHYSTFSRSCALPPRAGLEHFKFCLCLSFLLTLSPVFNSLLWVCWQTVSCPFAFILLGIATTWVGVSWKTRRWLPLRGRIP